MRTAKELLIASKKFTTENRWLSWWYFLSTLTLMAILVAVSISNSPIIVRAVSSIFSGLVGIRLFIIYHDYQHGAILRGSPVAGFLMWLYGMTMLNPPSVWNRSHEHHHKNNSKSFGANIGSFPIMTERAYANASSSERFVYAATRHPVTIALGYLTIFIWGMCIRPFLLNPKRHFDGGLATLAHFGLLVGLGTMGIDVMILGMLVPLLITSGVGSYLFYAQHNYPSAKLQPRAQWSYVDAALNSSSFITMGPLMSWITGNIGYHHVHHLNSRIPFYRLPEAMAALEELQSPGITSLDPRAIAACLRLKLWSPEDQRFVGFKRT